MRIALCDDESRINSEMEKLISEYSFENDVDMVCEKYTSGEELLKADRYDLYFLDYMMDGLNGVQTARRLFEKFNNSVTVCFLTSYETAAGEVINNRVYADGFLTKPVDREKLFDKLGQLCGASYFNRIVIKSGSGIEVIYPGDIIYVEAMKKNTVVHMRDEDREYTGLLSDFESKYLSPKLFFRIHRSFIINMTYVSSFNSRILTLKNGTELPLKRKKEFEKAYDEFNYSINLKKY